MKIKISEDFLHFIWKFSLFKNDSLRTSENQHIKILSQGIQNANSGPDFFNARIKIHNTIWAGNVEVHIHSSDWNAHKHDSDEAYNNVILHVVYEHNEDVYSKNGNKIPALELKKLINENTLEKYNNLQKSKKWIPCSNDVKTIKPIIIQTWLNRLAIERIEKKTEAISKLLSLLNNNWNEAFYISLAKNFGMKTNAEPFEMLAFSLPQKIISKHKNNLLQLEALLFGQAGLLDEIKNNDAYSDSLKKEFSHLKNKYNLSVLPSGIWKFARIRPNSFPTIKLSQFAGLCQNSSHLFSKIVECEKYSDAIKMFQVSGSSYWRTHFTFGKESGVKSVKLGNLSIQHIFINTIVPFLFAYGRFKKNTEVEEKAISWLEKIEAEDNAIIKKWKNEGIIVKSAINSQALIQLKNEYCNKFKCTNCGIGMELLK